MRGGICDPDKPGVAGTFKYTALTWNKRLDSDTFPDGTDIPPVPGAIDDGSATGRRAVLNAHRNWTDADARRLRCASLSDMTILSCGRGESRAKGTDALSSVVNPGTHRRSLGGGTNAVFADTHVEWVQGSRIGW